MAGLAKAADEAVVIWGAGAIGGTIGAHLARAGHPVLFVDRVAEHVSAMNDEGLLIDGPVSEFRVSAQALRPEDVRGQYKLILLAVKAQHTEEATRALLPHLAPDGAVVSCQNGLNELVIAGTAGAERTVGAFVNFGADWIAPGRITFGGRGAVVVGELGGQRTPRIKALHRMMQDFEPNAVLTDNIFGYLWGKLAYGAILKASALTDETLHDFFASASMRPLVAAIAQEVLRVAEAEGVRALGFQGFDPDAFLRGDPAEIDASMRALNESRRSSAKLRSGIWRDLVVRRRQSEVRGQLTPVQEAARRHRLGTPILDHLLQLIEGIERGELKTGIALAEQLRGTAIAAGSASTPKKKGPLMAQQTEAPDAEIQPDALMRHVQEFTKRVKLSGTPEELESFRYLDRTMDGMGFRTRLLSHDAYISLPGKAGVEIDGKPVQAITHSFSRPSPAGGLAAELVYLNDGAAKDFADKDVRGKIVLVEGIASPGVASRASEAGAIGQLHISPNENRYEMCISPVWGSPSPDTLSKLPTTVVCTVANADGSALRDRVQHGEQPGVVLHAEVDTGWRKTPLLEAHMDAPGAGPHAPFLLFSGHHDTWYYGVMDNGTANATMLETARVLAGHRDQWRRGLRLCFWSGHSHGRYSGSAWYADEHWDELDRRCIAHVNVDSTGGIGANVLTASGVSAELAGLAKQVIHSVAGQNHAGKRSSRSSDASFWGVGIPSMFGSISHQAEDPGRMRNALGWWWHTEHDTIERIDRDNLVRDTRVFVRVIWRFLTDRTLPLDPAAQVETLVQELTAIAGAGNGLVPLDGLIGAARALRDKAQEALRRADSGSEAEAERVNRAMLLVARALVPLDYTAGNRFSHDAALPHPAWPALQGLRSSSSGDDALFAAATVRRTRNQVLHALRQADEALGAALA